MNRVPDQILELWPSGAPGALGSGPEDRPRLELYRAPRSTETAMLICPGGGYGGRAEHEGTPVALWMNRLGITCAVVHYRVAPYKHPAPLADVSQAMRLMRQHANDWAFDPARIGVLGFSAGGHLAATLSTHFEPDTRPALSVLLYPVITLGEPSTHTGSRNNLLPDPNDPKWINLLSNEMHVTAETPPAFIFHTADDNAVPVENALLYAKALRTAGVPFEMHIYEHGPHGVGLAETDPILGTWTNLCANWLSARGFGRSS